MKIIILSVMIFLGVKVIALSQTLPTPIFSYVPCYGVVGSTNSVTVHPVPGATGYIWETNPLQINGALFNGLISPVETSIASTNITYTLAQQYWEVCVTAFSACCTSAQVCDTISGYNSIQFNPNNNPVALPNSTAPYGIIYDCLGATGVSFINWSVTGDITLSNGGTTLQTGSNTTDIPLTFGPGFTTGTLCVYIVTSFGLATDTICMTINAPVGITENNSPQINFYVENQNLFLEQPASSITKSIKIHDATGRLVFERKAIPVLNSSTIKIDLSTFRDGIYILTLIQNDKNLMGKFLITKQ